MQFKKWLCEGEGHPVGIKQDEFGDHNYDNKTEIVVLVGPPAIGKSTYIKNKFPKNSVYLVSRDNIVDAVAKSLGFTYDDMFQNPPEDASIGSEVQGKERFGVVLEAPPWMTWTKTLYSNIQNANNQINKMLENDFKAAVNSGKNVVVDMTNMTANMRKKALKYVDGKDFYKRAVVFTMYESDLPELLRRMKSRSDEIKAQGGSKTVGSDVINRMIASFQQISPEEGFDKVDTVKTFVANSPSDSSKAVGQFLRENKMLAVDIESLLPHKDDMEVAVHSLQNSRPSTDRNPIEVWATGDGRFVVVNGHHRLLQVILRGEESKVQVTVTGQANSISGTVVLDFYDGDFYGLDSSLENGWLLPRLRSY